MWFFFIFPENEKKISETKQNQTKKIGPPQKKVCVRMAIVAVN